MKTIREVAAVGLLFLSGCAQAGGIGDVLGGILGGGAQQGPAGGSSGAVVAEVRRVDVRNRIIDVETEDGQSVDVRYDDQTRVVYRQQEYEVSALEPGDVIRMNLSRTSSNEYYTQQIEVQQSVQERGGGGQTGSFDPDRLYQLSGTVDQIDYDRGLFMLRNADGQVLTVGMPYNATSATRDRFQRLRRGNTVRVEGRFVSEDRLELARFL